MSGSALGSVLFALVAASFFLLVMCRLRIVCPIKPSSTILDAHLLVRVEVREVLTYIESVDSVLPTRCVQGHTRILWVAAVYGIVHNDLACLPATGFKPEQNCR